MVRVKINQKQADAIERLKKEQYKRIEEVKANSEIYLSDWEKPLFQLDADDIQNALFEGYEVEPEFYVGDWVNHRLHGIGKVIEVNKNTLEIYRSSGDEEGAYVWRKKNVRHATKQEAWWAKHGRDVWELKPGDIIRVPGRSFHEVTSSINDCKRGKYTFNDGYDLNVDELKSGIYELACLVEDRKDVDNE